MRGSGVGSNENFGMGIAVNDMNDGQFEEFMRRLDRSSSRRNQMDTVSGIRPTISGTGIGGTQSSSANIGIGGIGGIGDITKQAKDLAQFRLGLDFQQMDKSALLREQESANNFGRTTKLTDQTKGWERTINNDTQNAMTRRNTDVINKEKDMQNTGINQENFATRRAIGLASRGLGSR